MTNVTVLQTRQAEIKGKFVNVETIKGKGKQEIAYRINGRIMDAGEFWTKKPVFCN
jgi:hypothetical protein